MHLLLLLSLRQQDEAAREGKGDVQGVYQAVVVGSWPAQHPPQSEVQEQLESGEQEEHEAVNEPLGDRLHPHVKIA